MTAPHEYDSFQFKRPRKKRTSLITGRATSLHVESEIQISCVVRYQKLCDYDRALREKTELFAISPNDGQLPVNVRVLAQRMGKKKGPHDLQFIDKRSGFAYWWIEIKKPGEGYTKEQADFAAFFEGTPVRCAIVYSADDFEKVIRG